MPPTGEIAVIGGAGSLISGWHHLEPAVFKLARQGRTVLLPLEQFLAGREYDDADATWVENVPREAGIGRERTTSDA